MNLSFMLKNKSICKLFHIQVYAFSYKILFFSLFEKSDKPEPDLQMSKHNPKPIRTRYN